MEPPCPEACERKAAAKDRELTRRSAAAAKAARHNKEMYTDDGNEAFPDVEGMFGAVWRPARLRNIDRALVALGVPTHRLGPVQNAILMSIRYTAPEAILAGLAVRVYQALRSHVPDSTRGVSLEQVRIELIRAGVEPNSGPQTPRRVILLKKDPGSAADAMSPDELEAVADRAGVTPDQMRDAVEGSPPQSYVLEPVEEAKQVAAAREASARWVDYNQGSRKGPSRRSAEDKPMWKARKEACARQKVHESIASSPKAIIGAQLAHEAAAAQGASDAEAEREKEERAKEALARAVRSEHVDGPHQLYVLAAGRVQGGWRGRCELVPLPLPLLARLPRPQDGGGFPLRGVLQPRNALQVPVAPRRGGGSVPGRRAHEAGRG